MAFPTGSNIVSYSGNYIPELWPSLLIVNWHDISVVPDITNRNYEGVVSAHGDKLNIRTTPKVTSRAYVIGSLGTPEQPKSDNIALYLNKGSNYNFVLPTVTARQMDIDAASVFIAEAAFSQKNFIEDDVLGALPALADSHNIGIAAGVKSGAYNLGTTSAPFAATATNIIDAIGAAEATLDEQNVPDEGRYMLIPPVLAWLIKSSELKDAAMTGDAKSILRNNSRLGRIGKFTLFATNRLSQVADAAGTSWHCLFGCAYATTFATQITESREMPYTQDFGILYQGLQSYGYAVTKPEGLGDLYLRKG